MTVQDAVAAYCARLDPSAPVTLTCAAAAKAVAGDVGYEPGPPAVSRALNLLEGWAKITVDGKVAFRRNGIGRTTLGGTPAK